MEPMQSEKSDGIPRSSGGTDVASQTPQKMNEPLIAEPKLPERLKIIAVLFDQMTCSLRLLNLCKKSPTFRNVSAQVQVLTKREFLYRHLAQIKYILPGAVHIDKILVHDKRTLCMRPDVKITLLFDGIDVYPEQSKVIALQDLFASRLEDFASSHPEACDVPEAMLPELLHQSSGVFCQFNNTPEDVHRAAVHSHPTSEVGNLLEVAGTLQHFRNHFSDKVIVRDSEKMSLLVSQSPPLPSMLNQEIESKHENCLNSLCSESDAVNDQTINSGQDEVTPQGFPGFTSCMNSTQLTGSGPVGSVACESPAVKDSSSDESPLIETPAQVTPKRAIPNDDNKDEKSTHGEKCLSTHKPTKRSLNFSVEGDGSALVFALGESESHEHVHSNNICVAESSISTSGAVPQEERCNDAKDHSFNQTRSGMCQQMASCLPGTVAVINEIFQAAGCSSITKEELLHKIIINNYDIVERREAEEQVELLEKLVPDWIGKESTPSGDSTYSIKRVSSIESILSRLLAT